MSMSQVYVAGVGSVFPIVSIALTSKVCVPSVSELYVFGVIHSVNVVGVVVVLSSLHSKVAPIGLVLVKVKLAVDWLVGFVGLEVIVVSGEVVSTTPHDATAFAVLPTVSVILACPQNGPSGIGSVGIEYVPVVGQVNGVRVWFSVFVVPVVIEIVIVPPGSHVPFTVVVGVVTTGGTVTVM